MIAKYKNTFLIFFILLLQVIVFSSLNIIDKKAIRQLVWICVLYSSLLLCCGLLWKNKYTRILSILICSGLVINFSISSIMLLLYNSNFSITFADSILNTTPTESSSMISLYLSYMWIPLFFFALLLYTTHCIAKTPFSKKKLTFCSLSVLVPCLMFANYSVHDKYASKKEPTLSLVLEKTPFYIGYYFSQAAFYRTQMEQIHAHQINYNIQVKETNIDNYIVIIGESARTKNMSLYGYNRKTTPNIDHQKNNLLIYRHAIAPAPITTLSIPMILSPVNPENYHIQGFSDNILNLANNAGYTTYWFSVQESIGANANIVSSIAKYAKNVEWMRGYDSVLIEHLKYALNQKGKKLIFLHTNGSHESACKRYPKEESVFTGSKFEYDDCYDNSIHYTDKFIQTVIDEISDKKSVLIYFSDHGLERDERKSSLYYHGNITPTKEVYDVPFFIWYAPILEEKNRKTGIIEQRTPLTTFYPLMSELMGISLINNIPAKPDEKNIMVLDGALNVLPYDKLREHL